MPASTAEEGGFTGTSGRRLSQGRKPPGSRKAETISGQVCRTTCMTQSSNYSGLFKANCKDSGPDPKATGIRRISTNLQRLQIKASACLSFCTSTWALQNSSGPTALVLGKGTRSCQEFEYPLGMRAALPGSAGQDAKLAVTCCLQPGALSPAAVQGSHLPSEKRHQLSVIRQLPLCLLPWTWKFQPPQGFLVPSGYSFASIPTALGVLSLQRCTRPS